MAFNVKSGFVLSALFLGSSGAFAGAYGMAGCGLGSILIAPSGSQTSAATSNGTGSQLFGITTGTSNCKSSKEMAVITNQENFVSLNLGTLSKEMAQGKGESLAAFTETLGCDQESFSTVASTLKSNYGTIFSAPGAMAVLDSTKVILKSDPSVSSRCQYLN